MIEIITYENKYQPDFKRLNLEWLDGYGLTESHDIAMLDDPEGMIINANGMIFLAKDNDTIIGSAGIVQDHHHKEHYELVKMFVSPEYRGKGLSKLLLDRCLEEARKLGAQKMILFSSSKLQTALKLYEQYGFKHVDVTDSPFETADVRMELAL
ncbi:MAG TPA: GNAT family N-acetyltransferase [Chitinophagaceae bacterium]|jgi:GNAT superfamily N-acetyltransferase|nr:GNAT family N-acetyltransferase [Chitinophagaceae bacterium]